MNIADVVTLQEPTANKSVKDKRHDGLLRLHEQIEKVQSVRGLAQGEEAPVLRGLQERLCRQFYGGRAQLLVEHGFIPDDLKLKGVGPEGDPILKASETPKVRLSTVRDIADRLSFAVLPYAYLDPRSYEGERWEMKRAIRGFADSLSPWFDIYALAPVPYYDVQSHISDEADREMYVGSGMAQAFMAVSLTIPVLRSLKAEVDAVRSRQDRVEKQVGEIRKRLEALQTQVEAMQARMIRERIERQEAEESIRQEMTRRFESSFIAYEPMMLAVPRGRPITGDGWALVGPCWGPDFDDIVMTALGLESVAGQRKRLSKCAEGWKEFVR